MTVVSAFLVPGSPLPYMRPDNPPWGQIADAMGEAGALLAASKPDTVLIYSTQWFAVLDQLWQTRQHLQGTHVDENWHEYGCLDFDINVDTELAKACIEEATTSGIKSKAVDYDHFPVDTGTIVATHFLLGPDGKPVVITSNNLYHDGPLTEKIAATAVTTAAAQGKRVAIIGVGGLSGSFFRNEIDIADDQIASPEEDLWNRKMLDLIATGDIQGLRSNWDTYGTEARADMGMKHLSFVMGALGGTWNSAEVLAYGPVYGAGAAVVSFNL